MIADLSPGTASSTFDWLHSCGNGVYFSVASNIHGKELWRSDGTSAGTLLAEDLVPGDGASSPNPLGVVNGRFVFAAAAETVGREPRAEPCGGPHLVLENDGGFEAPPVGWTLDLPSISPGEQSSRILRLKNTGDTPVTGLSMEVSTSPQSGLTVTGVLPTTLAPGASAEITAGFAPSVSGRFSASVRVSVDSIVQFSFHLFGWATGPADSWRDVHFGSPFPMGIADELADRDKDGRINLLERAFGTSPHLPDSSAGLGYDKTESCFRFRWVGELRSGCTIVPEWSSSLEPDSWSSTGLHVTTTDFPDDMKEVEVSPLFDPDTRLFLRLRVTGGSPLLE
jgi:ELWxxDGT repeat protein